MAIEIISAELDGDWLCWLQISKDTIAYLLPATAPSSLGQAGLQAYFDDQAAYLWALAQEKGYKPDVYSRLNERLLLKAFIQVTMDEINLLRAQHSLAARTWDQLAMAVKNKLKAM